MSGHPTSAGGPAVLSRDPAVTGQFEADTQQVSEIVLTKGIKPGMIAAFAIAFSIVQLLLVSIAWLLIKGTGIWGLNVPVAWGFAIVNFVWWIGIGHAGTLISAILLLFRQEWRTSISRFSEAMTLFAVACAGLFPLFHVGRPWFAYWLFPYPNTMAVWPQFRSPLLWDVFAVSTYASVSLAFWYVGLIPDLATLRDRAKNRAGQMIFAITSLGWIGSSRHWRRYTDVYLLLAGLATPLVLSVHTIVSFDFAISQVPGWHATIFPPYFVAGAIFSGFAMVLTLVIPIRAIYKLENFFTDWHLDCMAKVMLASGLVVGYGYILEHFAAWYSEHPAEIFMLFNRMFGPYWWSYWALMLCNIAIPQLL
ncbi:MAG TPA: NrfD/PsrC family molybdoenzyme membrane anchor subunit, partial [Planctomicrobium sp.]|nr:NrfD/PsrC family molybdoenzyme membrane anchor subunit [Planctomicrobium sp.]